MGFLTKTIVFYLSAVLVGSILAYYLVTWVMPTIGVPALFAKLVLISSVLITLYYIVKFLLD